MILVQCNGCRSQAFVDCTCPPEHLTGVLGHLPEVRVGAVVVPACPMTDLGATVTCVPGAGCCDGSAHPGLSHDMAAHLGHPNMVAAAGRAEYEPDHDGDHVPGNPDCAVCRPVTITVVPGSVTLSPAVAVAGG